MYNRNYEHKIQGIAYIISAYIISDLRNFVNKIMNRMLRSKSITNLFIW